MFSSTLLVATAALAGLVSAQTLNYTTSGPLNITASQVPISQRDTWCSSQMITCPQICGGQAYPNTCNPNDLTYVCTCTDGSHPNISSYQQTLPFFVCTQWKANCIENNEMDLTAQQACLSVTCGSKNASAVGTSGGGSGSGSGSGSSSSSVSTSSATAAATSGSQSSSTSSSKGLAAATNFASSYGTQLLAGGMLAAFGLAL
ncbi:hypothetical protein BDY17DRAFT_198066 [Neohortaea acidophila]|uniref:DUF7707 domain-containing protein n=1 Tax=Neohortaea acidophila TaxID=245834 RepID=A0A6A6PKT5_9PEZI|nr:uncharacterized protein BDY17DRAFT_198066 [Neohortaea acidophila]KAF2480688.1 hypothetical protein BDY17DRAFT_198066 [Neohortaea acidophila]